MRLAVPPEEAKIEGPGLGLPRARRMEWHRRADEGRNERADRVVGGEMRSRERMSERRLSTRRWAEGGLGHSTSKS